MRSNIYDFELLSLCQEFQLSISYLLLLAQRFLLGKDRDKRTRLLKIRISLLAEKYHVTKNFYYWSILEVNIVEKLVLLLFEDLLSVVHYQSSASPQKVSTTLEVVILKNEKAKQTLEHCTLACGCTLSGVAICSEIAALLRSNSFPDSKSPILLLRLVKKIHFHVCHSVNSQLIVLRFTSNLKCLI